MEPSPARARSRRGAVLRLLFGLAGVAFLVLAFRDTWDRTAGSVLPSGPRFGFALAAVVVALVTAAAGWGALLGVRGGALARGFYTAQLGKYIPGGLWQPVGQVGFAAGEGVPVGQATAAFPVHALVQVAAAGTVGALYALDGTRGGGARALALVGLVPLLLLRREVMAGGLRVLRRWAPRAAELLPEQRAIVACYAWSVATLAASGVSFALLATSVGAAERPAAAVAGFSLAWAVGFLALPIPAGIGVREAVLIATLGPAAPVVSASVFHRLVTMAGEAIMVVTSRLRRARAGSAPEP